MTSRRLPPGVVGVIVGYTISLWSFIPAWPADTSQAIVGSDERPTFVTWPEKGLGLSIDLTGFKKEIDQVKPDGRRYLMASHPKTKLDVSITLEKVPTKASATGCRHLPISRSDGDDGPACRAGVARRDEDGVSLVEAR